MSDEIDLANDRAELERAAALSRHASRQRRQGRETCAACGEAISDVRQAMGANHCVDHAAEIERRTGAGRRW